MAQKLGRGNAPRLFCFTDPVRTPDPVALARRLPRGAALVYRHFGAADRVATARALAKIARRRRLILLIGADPRLARAVGAAGVHLPERMAGAILPLKARYPAWIVTVAAHDRAALTRARGADAAILSPVFPSRSASAGAALGPLKAQRLARGAPAPVIALGGVNARTAPRLIGRSFAGLAAVEAFLTDI